MLIYAPAQPGGSASGHAALVCMVQNGDWRHIQ